MLLLLFLPFNRLLGNDYNLLLSLCNCWGGSSLHDYFRCRNFFNFFYFLRFWRYNFFYLLDLLRCWIADHFLSFFRRLLFFHLNYLFLNTCNLRFFILISSHFARLLNGLVRLTIIFLLWLFWYFGLGIFLLWLFCWRNILAIIPTWFLAYQCF